MGVARQWFGKQKGKDFAKEGVTEKINILTAAPHSCIFKWLSMLGIGSRNFTEVKLNIGNSESVDLADLEQKIIALNGEPFILISSAGTVNTVDFDDLKAISNLKEKYNFFWHIDAAFGAFASLSENHKHLVSGWELADSIAVDCHKWLNVLYESAVFFVKEKHKLLQVETYQNSNAPYLGNPLENFSYLNLLPENSRRLKALPAWFSLKAYGKEDYRDIVGNNINIATEFGEFINQHSSFELLAPVRLNTVCFTLSGENGQEKISSCLTKLNDTGKVFMTPTMYKGKKGIRAAFVNWRTDITDLETVFELMNHNL